MTKLHKIELGGIQTKTVSLSSVHSDRANRNSEGRSLAGAVLARKVLGQ